MLARGLRSKLPLIIAHLDVRHVTRVEKNRLGSALDDELAR